MQTEYLKTTEDFVETVSKHPLHTQVSNMADKLYRLEKDGLGGTKYFATQLAKYNQMVKHYKATTKEK